MKRQIVVGDYGYPLTFTLTQADGSALDLTNQSSIKMRVAKPKVATAHMIEDCTVVGDATDGVCKYTVADGDFDEEAMYDVSIVVTFPASRITADGNQIEALRELPST